MRKFHFILIILLITGHKLLSVPAYPHPIDITQPDGSKITLRLKGDESFHWYETADGFTLLKNSKGMFEYAAKLGNDDLKPSGIPAKNIEQRTADEKLFLSTIPPHLTYSQIQVSMLRQIKKVAESGPLSAFPTSGSRNLVCILIGFTDLAFTKTQSEFNNLFNQVEYTTDDAMGSVKDYYLESSYNQLTLSVTVAGPYTAANTMAYYGANSGGNDIRPRELITEAVNLANPDVNYANFDNDADGAVDGVYVIYAGYGEEAGASEDAIWAHAWNIPTLTLDGKTISKYSCSAELRGNSGTGLTRIGVICHEFGHVLGAPDYYDTDYSTGGQYTGTGHWDMMAGGSWNLSGACPAQHNVYTKWRYYNWLTPTLLNSAGNYSLTNSVDNQSAYYFRTPTTGEIFIMENRQQTGFDSYIPGSGLLIYHVDSTGINYAGNDINATHPQLMYPVCASSNTNPSVYSFTYGDINSAGCPFPGSSGKTEFSDGSLPGAIDWLGNASNKPLTSISESAGVISFSFMNSNLPQNFLASTISNSEIDLSWVLNSGNNPVLIAYSTTGSFGTPANGAIYSPGNTIPGGGTVLYYGTATSFNHTSLTPSTSYYYKAWSNVSDTYSTGLSQNASTLCEAISTFPWEEDFEQNGNTPNCWTQKQLSSSGIYWMFTTGNGGTKPATSHGGTYNACLRDYSESDNKTRLITPTLNITSLTNARLTFWRTQAIWESDQDTLIVSYRTSADGIWSQLAKYSDNVTDWKQETLALPNGSSDYYIAFIGNATYGYGICIDDVSVYDESVVPLTRVIENDTIDFDESACYDATDTITLAGGDNRVDYFEGSTVNLVAGKSITFLPGFWAHEDSYMYAWITTEAAFCSSLPLSSVVNPIIEKSTTGITEEKEETKSETNKRVKVFPNPTSGRVTLEMENFEGISHITVINTLGEVVHRSSTMGNKTPSIDLSKNSKGLYLVTIQHRSTISTAKVIIR
jgi:M6 family metalloprotease-like protein